MFDKKNTKLLLKFLPVVSISGPCTKVGLEFVPEVKIPYQGVSSFFTYHVTPPVLTHLVDNS